jgi:hypothetical protein
LSELTFQLAIFIALRAARRAPYLLKRGA